MKTKISLLPYHGAKPLCTTEADVFYQKDGTPYIRKSVCFPECLKTEGYVVTCIRVGRLEISIDPISVGFVTTPCFPVGDLVWFGEV